MHLIEISTNFGKTEKWIPRNRLRLAKKQRFTSVTLTRLIFKINFRKINFRMDYFSRISQKNSNSTKLYVWIKKSNNTKVFFCIIHCF